MPRVPLLFLPFSSPPSPSFPHLISTLLFPSFSLPFHVTLWLLDWGLKMRYQRHRSQATVNALTKPSVIHRSFKPYNILGRRHFPHFAEGEEESKGTSLLDLTVTAQEELAIEAKVQETMGPGIREGLPHGRLKCPRKTTLERL